MSTAQVGEDISSTPTSVPKTRKPKLTPEQRKANAAKSRREWRTKNPQKVAEMYRRHFKKVHGRDPRYTYKRPSGNGRNKDLENLITYRDDEVAVLTLPAMTHDNEPTRVPFIVDISTLELIEKWIARKGHSIRAYLSNRKNLRDGRDRHEKWYLCLQVAKSHSESGQLECHYLHRLLLGIEGHGRSVQARHLNDVSQDYRLTNLAVGCAALNSKDCIANTKIKPSIQTLIDEIVNRSKATCFAPENLIPSLLELLDETPVSPVISEGQNEGQGPNE